MTKITVNCVNLLLLSLGIGIMFGTWLGYPPSGLPPSICIKQQQHIIRSLNVLLQLLGMTCILLTFISALLARGNPRMVRLLLGAVACLLAASLVAVLVNAPIDSQVMTWNPQAPPLNWMDLMDQWYRWHFAQLVAGIDGLCFLLLASVGAGCRSTITPALGEHTRP